MKSEALMSQQAIGYGSRDRRNNAWGLVVFITSEEKEKGAMGMRTRADGRDRFHCNLSMHQAGEGLKKCAGKYKAIRNLNPVLSDWVLFYTTKKPFAMNQFTSIL